MGSLLGEESLYSLNVVVGVGGGGMVVVVVVVNVAIGILVKILGN